MRSAEPQLTIACTDVTGALSGDATRIRVTSELHGRADDISVRLADPDRRFLGRWRPEPGQRMESGTQLTDWRAPGDTRSVTWGTYQIDELTHQGPPTEVDISAQSAFIDRSMRNTRKTRGWENVALSTIAKDLADENGFALAYEAGIDPSFDRKEQRDESDLRFLRKELERWFLHLSAKKERMVVISDRELTALEDPIYRSASAEGADPMLSCNRWRVTPRYWELARRAEVRYDQPVENQVVKAEVTDQAAPESGETLTVNEKMRDTSQAELRAARRLSRNNRREIEAQATVPGRPSLRPGFTVPLQGFQDFDGEYVITAAEHRFAGKYTTRVQLRKTRNRLL